MTKTYLPLDIDSLEITSQSLDNKGDIILKVVSKKRNSICHKCGKPATKPHGTAPIRRIQHLSVFDKKVYLEITPIRYACEECKNHPTTAEQYDWCDRNATISKGLESYLMRSLINSTLEDVSKKNDLGIKLVQSVLNRQIKAEVSWDQINDLGVLGIDEIAIKKGQKSYVTIVSSKSENELKVIGVLEGRSKDEVLKFLQSIPKTLQKTVTAVCSDMHEGFVNAIIEVFGVHRLVIDRYHVAKLYRKPLDQLRIKEMARLKKEIPPKEYATLEGMMWIIRTKYECLTEEDKNKLELLYQYSPLLKKAHRQALKLTNIFNEKISRKSAIAKIDRWIIQTQKMEFSCYNSFLSTLEKYKPYIVNYFKKRRNSGFVEGLNNKIKVLKRRCYGLYKTTSIFQRIFLDLEGFQIYA
jgi:transposase